MAMRQNKKRIAGGFGSYGIAGSPQDAADELIELHRCGFSGASISFVDFTTELPFFVENVLPILARAGVR
jgi:FMNH2-dependent dimethyl sulfone monooxygenase